MKRRLRAVRQIEVDPYSRLPREVRREATRILNALREPTQGPLLLPISLAYVAQVAMDAAATQGLILLRAVVFQEEV
jgi:hypothetical protein